MNIVTPGEAKLGKPDDLPPPSAPPTPWATPASSPASTPRQSHIDASSPYGQSGNPDETAEDNGDHYVDLNSTGTGDSED